MLLLLACTPGSIDLPSGAGTDAVEVLPDVEEEPWTVPDADGCDGLLDADLLVQLDLAFAPADLAALEADYTTGTKAYHPAVMTWTRPDGGAETADVQVRLRGNPGFSWMGRKMQFAVSFNEDDPDARFHGRRKLALDASWYNRSGMRNRLAYAYLRAAGVPAPCTNHAFLTIDGAPYGLYENVEFFDHELLERLYGDEAAGGALWKYGTTVTANEEAADAAEMSAYWADATVATQAAMSDLDGNVYEWAAEAMLPQNDGYWCCNHNFYLYDHPTEGLAFVPWDMDYALDATPYWADPYTWYRDSNYQPHYDAVAADAEWGPRLVDAVRLAADAYDADTMAGWLADWAAQTEEWAPLDATSPHSLQSRADAIEELGEYLPARRQWVDAWVDCQAGDESDADGDGYGPCGDCDPDDATIHPGAAETCNARDDDCDGKTDDDPACADCQEFGWDGTRLLMCPSPRSWEAAREVCQQYGGDLGWPASTGELYVLWLDQYWDELAWAGEVWWWAGVTDAASEGAWVDMDGAQQWPGWASGEGAGGRAENCGAFSPSYWQWADADCARELPSICRL